jgi:hypothetical protein
LIKRRVVQVQDLQEELREYENEHGEMFVMLIGDYGGGSFKLMLANICSLEPNSPSSGYLIGELSAKESFKNLKEAFGFYQVRRRKEEEKM